MAMTPFQRTQALVSLFVFSFIAQAQNSPEIAPGVSLPATGAIVALDTVNGHPQAVTLHASEVKYNPHAAGNVARSLIYNGPHSSVEVEGTASKSSLVTTQPVFYIRLSSEDAEIQRNRLTLVRLMPDKKSRVVLELSANIFGGSRKRYVDDVAVAKIDVEGTSWLKIVPTQALTPGDYALLFLPKDQVMFPDSVYDFSISEPAK
jgi:hypothetical protein